jgi:uncharacterized iron-regulated membrane protein
MPRDAGAMTKQAWRRTWFQVHKWIGLCLAILVIPLSLSGAALVWDHTLDRLANPGRYAVSGTATLPPSRYVAAAQRVLGPGERIASLTWPDGRGPVLVSAAPPAPAKPRPGPPVRTNVYLDPPTARVLDRASSASGLVRFVHVLHGSLQIPGWGRTIVGLIGVAMAASCLTGLWLWWPMVGRWARGLRWRRHRHTDTNLHYLTGFWVALPLFILSVTGVLISFPVLTGGGGARRPPPALPRERAALDVGMVVAKAGTLGRGRATAVTWPTTRSADWTVAFGPVRSVKIADDTGTAVAAPGRGPGTGGSLVRRIHDGTGMGPVWQAIIFVGGIIPALLAVTGIIMWWRARGWKAALAARQRARAAA